MSIPFTGETGGPDRLPWRCCVGDGPSCAWLPRSPVSPRSEEVEPVPTSRPVKGIDTETGREEKSAPKVAS